MLYFLMILGRSAGIRNSMDSILGRTRHALSQGYREFWKSSSSLLDLQQPWGHVVMKDGIFIFVVEECGSVSVTVATKFTLNNSYSQVPFDARAARRFRRHFSSQIGGPQRMIREQKHVRTWC